jgi:hypothetical protein
LIVVGGLLLVATIVSAILWNTIGADSDGGEFPTPTSADPSGASPAANVASAGPVPETAAPPSTATFLSLRTYDLDSNDPHENDDLVGLMTDGDPGTFWRTECYDSIDLGGRPVGVAITLQAPAAGRLTIDVASSSWMLQVYTSLATEAIPATLEAWGEPVGSQSGSAPEIYDVPLTGAAAHIAIVFTEVGPSGACTPEFPNSGAIAEVQFAPLA